MDQIFFAMHLACMPLQLYSFILFYIHPVHITHLAHSPFCSLMIMIMIRRNLFYSRHSISFYSASACTRLIQLFPKGQPSPLSQLGKERNKRKWWAPTWSLTEKGEGKKLIFFKWRCQPQIKIITHVSITRLLLLFSPNCISTNCVHTTGTKKMLHEMHAKIYWY